MDGRLTPTRTCTITICMPFVWQMTDTNQEVPRIEWIQPYYCLFLPLPGDQPSTTAVVPF